MWCYRSTKCGTTDCSTVGLIRRGMDLFVCNAAFLLDRNIIKCNCLPLSNNFCQRPCCALASHEYFRAFRDLQRPTGRHQVPSRRAHSTFECGIHSFIPAISIAPLQVLYHSETLPTTARILYRSFTPKRNVHLAVIHAPS